MALALKADHFRKGQKRRLDPAPITSGLPDQQTFTVLAGMSQTCQRTKSLRDKLAEGVPHLRER